MSDNSLEQLRRAYEMGIIDETTYRVALAGHELSASKIEAIIIQDSTITTGDKPVIASKAGRDIVTGDSTVTSEGDIIARDIITGIQINYIVNQYHAQRGQQTDKDILTNQIAGYLNWIISRYGTIELRGIKREGEQVVGLNLESVYVPLQARAYQRYGGKEIALDQVLSLGRRAVIVGGPGSGKTTVLLHMAWTLAQAIKTDNIELAKEKLGLDEKLPLPIFVPLSAYNKYLRELSPGTKGEQKTLAAFISDYLIQKQAGIDLPPDFFIRMLKDGQAVILLLDGLDEVPNENERMVVREAIEELITGREEKLRVVVTCRIAAYKGNTALGIGFKQVDVMPLEWKHITKLIQQAYNCIYKDELHTGGGEADKLLESINQLEENRRLRLDKNTKRLIDSPLLVRMLLIVHYSERRLPDQRAELYMRATDAMLLPRYNLDEASSNEIGGLVGGSQEIHREMAQYLAFEMQKQGKEQGREIDGDRLKETLEAHPLYGEHTTDLITLTRTRGTLLEEQNNQYRFIHLAFQEYLAARYLAETVRSDKGIEGIAAFLEEGHILDSWWREPALLVAGYLTVDNSFSARQYLLRLAGADGELNKRSVPSADIQLAGVELACSAAMEWPNVPIQLKETLINRLVNLFQTQELMDKASPTRRFAIGNTLAHLGDPRKEVMTIDKMTFCYVPPGLFMMGSDDTDDMARSDEKPLHKVELPGYWIGKYLVTVAQFKAFVDESGQQSRYKDSLRDPLNRPVRWITWYEAMNFCKWLTDKWQKVLPQGFEIKLPNEAQWEKAARGGLEIIDGQPIVTDFEKGFDIPELILSPNDLPERRYPWGNKVDPSRMNYNDTGIGTTSAVGCFPGGISPYGCLDMSGNIYEWCLSKYESYPYKDDDRNNPEGGESRILRGGYYGSEQPFARVSYRGIGNHPVNFNFTGVRVVAASV